MLSNVSHSYCIILYFFTLPFFVYYVNCFTLMPSLLNNVVPIQSCYKRSYMLIKFPPQNAVCYDSEIRFKTNKHKLPDQWL